MKKKLNVIQIKGMKGLLLAVFVVCCAIAGFIVFPGWLGMNLWNLGASYIESLPNIGLFQGVLLWAILVTSYFLFRKEKVVVCFKSPEGLSEEELKSVFADMKKQVHEDPVIQAMLKAREAELKYKAQQEMENKETAQATNSDNSNA